MRGPGILLLLLLVLPALTGCTSVGSYRLFSAGASYWEPELDGTVRYSAEGILGTPIDVVELLDVDRKDQTGILHGEIGFGPVALEGRYTEVEYEGDTILNETISFLGEDFPINARVQSRLAGTMASANLKLALLGTEGGGPIPRVMVGGLLGGRYMELEAELVALSPITLREEDRTEVAFPVVGAIGLLEQPIPLAGDLVFFVDGTVAGFPHIEYDDVEGEYLEILARGGLRLLDVFSIGVGWRSVDVDFTFDDGPERDSADVTLEGLIVFGELRF